MAEREQSVPWHRCNRSTVGLCSEVLFLVLESEEKSQWRGHTDWSPRGSVSVKSVCSCACACCNPATPFSPASVSCISEVQKEHRGLYEAHSGDAALCHASQDTVEGYNTRVRSPELLEVQERGWGETKSLSLGKFLFMIGVHAKMKLDLAECNLSCECELASGASENG